MLFVFTLYEYDTSKSTTAFWCRWLVDVRLCLFSFFWEVRIIGFGCFVHRGHYLEVTRLVHFSEYVKWCFRAAKGWRVHMVMQGVWSLSLGGWASRQKPQKRHTLTIRRRDDLYSWRGVFFFSVKIWTHEHLSDTKQPNRGVRRTRWVHIKECPKYRYDASCSYCCSMRYTWKVLQY